MEPEHDRVVASTTAPRLRVLQVGTTMGGGVSSVIDLVVAEVAEMHNVVQRRLVTHGNGSASVKARMFIKSVAALLVDLCANRTDLYHVHFSTGASTIRKIGLVFLIALFRKPVVGHSHGGRYVDFYNRQAGRAGRPVIRWFLRRFDRLIVLSPEWRQFFDRIVESGATTIVPNAVRILPQHRPTCTERFHVLALGLLGPRKGTGDLLRAFARLAHGDSRLYLDLAGDGDLEQFRALAAQYGIADRVTIHGWVAGAAREALIQNASVYALPSYAEGLPMAMLECMAAGLPVIVTPVGGIPSVVSHDNNGLLVQPGDVDGIAEAIKRLVDEPARAARLGSAGRQSVVDNFGAARFASMIRATYDAALAARRSKMRS